MSVAALRSSFVPRLLTGLRPRKIPFSSARHRGYGAVSGDGHKSDQYNEPGGYLFGRKPGERLEMDTPTKLYVVFYLGGLAVFLFLYQYKPETDPDLWARREALRRMKARGVNLEEYRYKLPDVY